MSDQELNIIKPKTGTQRLALEAVAAFLEGVDVGAEADRLAETFHLNPERIQVDYTNNTVVVPARLLSALLDQYDPDHIEGE